MSKHKHAEVLIAMAEGKQIEYLSHSVERKVWKTPNRISDWNPIARPTVEWRIKPDSPKNAAWKKVDEATTLSFNDLEWTFMAGWHECVDYQYRMGLIELVDANSLRK